MTTGGNLTAAAYSNYQWRLELEFAPHTVLEQIEGLAESAWTDIGMEKEAIFASHRPSGWDREQHYVVIRRRRQGAQLLMVPHHTVILVSRNDLPLKELVRRHRGKQGQENAFKGPLRDMDLHHPPCRSYRANQAFYALGQIAQVLLRAVQYTALPKSARRHGIRSVIRYVVRTAAHMVRTGRRVVMRFAKTNYGLDWLYSAMVHLEARAPPLPTAARPPSAPTPPCGGGALARASKSTVPQSRIGRPPGAPHRSAAPEPASRRSLLTITARIGTLRPSFPPYPGIRALTVRPKIRSASVTVPL